MTKPKMRLPWPWSSVQIPCPLVRAWSGLASPGLGTQRRASPQGAVWTPQEAPFSRAQAMQQPQPGSLSTCLQSAGTGGQLFSFSCVHGTQRIGSGPTTGDEFPTARTARVTAATNISFSYNPGISSSQICSCLGDCLCRLLCVNVVFLLKWILRSSYIYMEMWPPEELMIDTVTTNIKYFWLSCCKRWMTPLDVRRFRFTRSVVNIDFGT